MRVKFISNVSLWLIAATFVFAYAMPLPQANAASRPAQKLIVSAAAQNISLDPGATHRATLTLANQGTDAFTVNASIVPYSVNTVDYSPQFTPLPGAKDITKWVTIDGIDNNTITPGGVRDFTYTVSAPASASPGGYYAVILITSKPLASKGITIQNRVGVVLYINVNGEVKKQGDIVGLPLPWIVFGGAVDISADIRNSGGVHFLSEVTTQAKDIFGATVWQQQDEELVLPGTSRRIHAAWQPDGLIGLYKVQRSATINQQPKQAADKVILYVHPLFIVGVASIIGCVVLLAWRRINKKARGIM